VAALALLGSAACSSGGKHAAPTTSTATAAAPAVEPGADPLTGLHAQPGPPARPALVVKIDNAPKARPQAGVNDADVVVEEGVEGGVTRFGAIFHSRDADSVGPVRSARSTDISFAGQLGRPLFAYSGANGVFADLLRKSPLIDIGVGRVPTAYHREPGRPAPYNLFSATPPLFAAGAGDAAVPAPLFSYRPAGEAAPAAGSEKAGRIQGQWKGRIVTTVIYQWDEAAKGWARSQDGGPHLDARGLLVAPENVVFQVVRYHDTGLVDASGAAVPEAELIGDGEAWVLTDGRLIKGRWARPGPEAITSYTNASGAAVRLTPGRTWIELVPVGNLTAL
jgi:hypothetical protein